MHHHNSAMKVNPKTLLYFFPNQQSSSISQFGNVHSTRKPQAPPYNNEQGNFLYLIDILMNSHLRLYRLCGAFHLPLSEPIILFGVLIDPTEQLEVNLVLGSTGFGYDWWFLST